jgi:hypothetical protein
MHHDGFDFFYGTHTAYSTQRFEVTQVRPA